MQKNYTRGIKCTDGQYKFLMKLLCRNNYIFISGCKPSYEFKPTGSSDLFIDFKNKEIFFAFKGYKIAFSVSH